MCSNARPLKKKTRPPKRFTEATLLTAMETAGKTLDEKELSDAMKETGLGTPATRASIIEVLLKREYIVRQRQEPGSDRQGHPPDRGSAPRSEESGHDRAVGSLSRSVFRTGQAQLEPFLEGHRGLCSGRRGQGRSSSRQGRAEPARLSRNAATDRECRRANRGWSRAPAQEGQRLDELAPQRLRIPLVPRQPGGGLPRGHRRPRRAAGHADRRRASRSATSCPAWRAAGRRW